MKWKQQITTTKQANDRADSLQIQVDLLKRYNEAFRTNKVTLETQIKELRTANTAMKDEYEKQLKNTDRLVPLSLRHVPPFSTLPQQNTKQWPKQQWNI